MSLRLLVGLAQRPRWLIGIAGDFFSFGLQAVAVLGAVVLQSAFQAGPLPASVPVMDAMEPAVAVCIGVFAFNESVDTSVGGLAFQALGILLLLWGIVSLDRSPIVLELQAKEPREDLGPVNAGAVVTDGAQ